MKYRNKNYDREVDKLDKLKHENKKLKKEVATLRKELSRLESRYSGLDDLVRQQEDEVKKNNLEKMKVEWNCFKCGKDYLRLILFSRLDGMHYCRKCPTCGNRTKLKKYDESVKGIKE